MQAYDNSNQKSLRKQPIDWDTLEDSIKEHEDNWNRFMFCSEQFGHSAVNVLVEGLRKIGIGEIDEDIRKSKYEGGDDLAYTIGHVLALIIFVTLPMWSPLLIFGGALYFMYTKARRILDGRKG